MARGSGGGTRAASIYAPENWSQRRQRSEMMFQDQHGREWYGAVEIKTGDVVGLLQPQFTAPLIPDQKYLKRVERRPYDLFIDYEHWKRDRYAAISDWVKEGRQRAAKQQGSKYRPGTEDFPEEVLDIIGPKPPAVDPIIAAQQGNKWVLGLTKNWRVNRDKRLAEFFSEEELDEEVRRANEPDYSDRYPMSRVGRGGAHEEREKEIVVPGGRAVPMSSNRPQRARGEGKEERRRASRPKTGASSSPRERYPQGHERAGQFVPKAAAAGGE